MLAGKGVWQFLMKSATSLAFDQHFTPKYLHKSDVNPGPQKTGTPSSAHARLYSEWPGTGHSPKIHQPENGCGPSALKTECSNKSQSKVFEGAWKTLPDIVKESRYKRACTIRWHLCDCLGQAELIYSGHSEQLSPGGGRQGKDICAVMGTF